MNILVTGSAGFIGYHLSKRLLAQGNHVVGVDSFNDYYDPKLKEARNSLLEGNSSFKLFRGNLEDYEFVDSVFKHNSIDVVCHLAAQAGVRYSYENPIIYEQRNNITTVNVLEGMRRNEVQHIVFASSSSVYGGITEVPFKETMKIDRPLSFYAATKLANEAYVHVYHHLFGLKAIGLRFFSIYGPWGRPDNAYFIFTQKILSGEPIQIFNFGKQQRDWTYIEDIINGIELAIAKTNELNYEIINMGKGSPQELMDYVTILEELLGKTAGKQLVDAQPGDVTTTYSDNSKALQLLGYKPKIELKDGLKGFVDWYLDFYY